jgi:O-antigen ligase
MKKFSLPEIIVFAVAALLPTYLIRFHIGPFPTTVLEIVLVVAIGALAIEQISSLRALAKQSHEDSNHGDIPMRLLRRLWPPRNDGALLTIGSTLIIIATIVGIVVAPDKRAALGIAKAFFWEPMALAWLIIATRPDKEKIWRAALSGFALSAFVVIIYGLLQYAHPALIPATWTAERRITSVFDYPNAAALYLAPLTALLLSSPVTIALAFFAVVIIILAKSAGGLVAVAAALFFLGVIKKKTRAATIVAAIIAILIVLLLPAAAGLRDQILLRDWSGRVHQIGWKESFAMLKDHPLFGAGLDGFKTVVAPYHHAQGVEIFQYPHNLFLAAWSEIGLIGLIGLITILVWFFRRIYVLRSKFYVLCLAAAMLAVLIHGLVDVPYFKNDLAMMFWLFITIVAL